MGARAGHALASHASRRRTVSGASAGAVIAAAGTPGWVLEAKMQWLASFLANENGATAIEYALIAGFIAVGIIAAVGNIGTTVSGIFTEVAAGF